MSASHDDSSQSRKKNPQAANQSQVVSFETLSGGRKEVVIEHQGECYRLRVTRKGGLILNK